MTGASRPLAWSGTLAAGHERDDRVGDAQRQRDEAPDRHSGGDRDPSAMTEDAV